MSESLQVRLHTIILSEKTLPNEGFSRLIANIKPNGDLQLEGYDVGPTVEAFFRAPEYEYNWTVKAADVNAVLLNLLKERFAEGEGLQDWLDSRGIPHEFDTWP